jgi:hypothetical protein
VLVPNTGDPAQLGHLPVGRGGDRHHHGVARRLRGAGHVRRSSGGPNRLYADSRRNQIDMRFAKIVRFGARRLDVGRGPAEPAERELRNGLRLVVRDVRRHAEHIVREPDVDRDAAVRRLNFTLSY